MTRAAVPNLVETVSLKLDFVSPIDPSTGTTSQALPVSRLEVGLGRGWETVLQMPLLRVSDGKGDSVLAAGQFSMALQYLLAGSPGARYAISVSGRLEVPSGDSAVVGNQTQLMPSVFAEWHAAPSLLFRSNVGWNTTIAGTTARFAYLAYSDAVVWMASRHFLPVFEFAASTSTFTGDTQFVLQPEMIVAEGRYLELKAGLSVGLVPKPHYGIRAQLGWFWGKRQ